MSFLLGAILGMSMEDLIFDYELSSLSVWGVRSSESESFKTFLNILNDYGTKSDTIKTKCENYLISIGVTREEIEHIRDIMLEEVLL